MSNRVFFQHPDLMRILCVHENVMTIMINILGRAQQAVEAEEKGEGVVAEIAAPTEEIGVSQILWGLADIHYRHTKKFIGVFVCLSAFTSITFCSAYSPVSLYLYSTPILLGLSYWQALLNPSRQHLFIFSIYP